jgi:hypothetical protein
MSAPSSFGFTRNASHVYFSACFSVHASADPSIMPRVMAVFARRNLVPSQWHSTLCGSRRDELEIDVQLDSVEPAVADRIAAILRQIVGVERVLTSEKRLSPAA